MDWVHAIQFISAVPMPEELADSYGTTINGMWASPERFSKEQVEEAHAKGKRVLFSVPLIALTPQVYEKEEHRPLIQEACRDIHGNTALVPWYYWEKKPVYSLCIYSETFRNYLLDRCRDGIDRGMDVVNLDEINTNIGLMDHKDGSSGFCSRCLERFRNHLNTKPVGAHPDLEDASDETLRERLSEDAELYQQYRRFQELEAFVVIIDFIQELRRYAQEHNPQFAISANVAYLGNLVKAQGDLWGPMWGEHLDFVLMENIYQPDRSQPHHPLPRGKFTAWYRLGSAFSSQAPVWICPSIMVPKQFAGEKRIEYYLLMFMEAYANGGRWGYYWWPGVDVETRAKATAPEQLKDYIQFIRKHRKYFEHFTTQNRLAILYLDSSMMKRPESHFKYIALAQALAEAGFQYDVIYSGDGNYAADKLDIERLKRYQALLVPEAEGLTDAQAETLSALSTKYGSQLILFTQGQPNSQLAQGTLQDEGMLFNFWQDYQDGDRQRIAACASPYVSERIHTSDPMVNAIRYVKENEQILHLINYNYVVDQDQVTRAERLSVRVPWEGDKSAKVRWLSLDGEQQMEARMEAGELVFEVPRLELYGLAILG